MKVKGHPNLRRTESGAIVNVNHGGLEAAQRRQASLQEKDDRLLAVERELEELKQLVRKLAK